MRENAMDSARPDYPALSRRHLQLLALLVVHERLNITAAARLMGLSGACMSRLVNCLVDLGYALREMDSNDRRIRHIFPTAAGRALDAAMRCRIAETPFPQSELARLAHRERLAARSR